MTSKKGGTIGDEKRWETKGFTIVPPSLKPLMKRFSFTPTGGTIALMQAGQRSIAVFGFPPLEQIVCKVERPELNVWPRSTFQ